MSEYTLFEKCVTEFLSSVTFIFLGNGVIANELLSRTKGHAVGYGFVSVGFGFAIGFTIAMFGYCSANLNPAGVICGWLKGTINGVEVVPLILSELLGAFTGALLVYLTYLPHYLVVPELETAAKHDETSILLRSGLDISSSALRVASHRPSLTNVYFTGDERENAIFSAALEADTVTKLSTFCTRPAISHPVYNFVTEMISTFTLLLGASLIEDRFSIQGNEQATLFYSKGLLPVMIGLYVTVLILSLGGPTGFSCNPSRDLGPRIAHYLLPIKGKGSSEFMYSLMINTAAFLGAVLAAGAFLLLKQLPIR